MKGTAQRACANWLLTLGITCFAPSAQASVEYLLTDLGALPVLGYPKSGGQDINDLGEVAVSIYNATAVYKVYRFSSGTLTDLGPAPTTPYFNFGMGINNLGDVVGYAGSPNSSAILWAADGSRTAIGTLGGQNSVAWGINDAGQITGWANPAGSGNFHAYVYQAGSMTDLGTLGGAQSQGLKINEAGEVAGYAQITGSTNYHPFVFSNGVMTDLGTLGGAQGYAADLNDAGLVTGDAENTAGARRAFIYDRGLGVMTDLGTLSGSLHSTGQGINAAGVVVGFAFNTANVDNRPFIYRSGEMVDLNDLIAPAAGWVLTRARAINDAGQITGFASFNGQDRGFMLTPVPEAGAGAMLLAGLLVLGVLSRRRRA